MIDVVNVSKSFDGFKALDGLNLYVPRGSIYGLVGPNGAGKSTILRHITGIYKQDEGDILVGGEPVFENPEIKKHIAYIPDDIFWFSTATLRDMMKFYRGIYPDFDTERFEKLGESFEFDDKRQMRRLSKGMQKQAAFRLCLSMHPQLMVLDEPVDGLDPVMRRRLWGLIMEDVAEYGTTVLISSHNLRELEDVCDQVGIMKNGKMLLQHSLAELQENIVKIQLALQDGAKLPDGLSILHESGTGRLKTLILRGKPQEVESVISAANPLFYDVLPLTLEEIFIYELGGADSEVKDLVL
jgi:ABC-2 type transport system ATP-binding protein